MSNALTLRTSSRTLPGPRSTGRPVPRSAPRAPSTARPLPNLLKDLNLALLRAVEVLETWSARREQRRTLRTLPDHLLQDIGRSRADAEAEAAKPFWQA